MFMLELTEILIQIRLKYW